MERAQQKAAPKPQPVDPAEAQQKLDEFKAGLFQNAVVSIFESLEAHKRVHGMQMIDEAALGSALAAFASFLRGNRKFVPGQDTDALIRVGIEVIAKAGAAAKTKAEERRIITL